MGIFTRESIIQRRDRVASSWAPILSQRDCVLVFSGRPVTKPGGLDQSYHFLPHPSYYWLTGSRRPFGVVAYSKELGWVDFVQPITKEEKVWEGATTLSEQGLDVSTLESFLKTKKFERTSLLGQVSVEDRVFESGASEKIHEEVKIAMDSERRIKDREEIAMIRRAAMIAHKGYQKIQNFIRPGITERDIQIEYEAEVQRHGAHRFPYDTIVGTGTNAAVLHAIPTSRKVNSEDLVLIDAGVDIFDYCVDITRVFPAGGRFSTRQKDIYDLVKSAQARAIESSQVGVEWHDVHKISAQVIAEGLKILKLISCSVEAALETGAISVFYPHGVGHLVGLRVRDVGHEENRTPKSYCGARLRVDLTLQENYVITVEPGCYFIEALIRDPETRTRYKDLIHWTEAEKWLDFGGVRIEDDILITKSAPDILTRNIEK